MANYKRQDAEALMLWFVVVCEGAGCGANVWSGISAADVRDVGEFAIAVAIHNIGVEEAGGIDNAGDIVGVVVAAGDGVGVEGAGDVGDVGVVARDALAIAPFDVDIGGIKLAGAVLCVKAAVVVRAHALSEVFIIISDLEQRGECVCAMCVSGKGVSSTGHVAAAAFDVSIGIGAVAVDGGVDVDGVGAIGDPTAIVGTQSWWGAGDDSEGEGSIVATGVTLAVDVAGGAVQVAFAFAVVGSGVDVVVVAIVSAIVA